MKPTFRESDHTYWLGSERLPSVTEILTNANIIDKAWYTEESAQRGSAVHRACQLLLEGNLNESTVDSRIAGYVAAFRAFKSVVSIGDCECEKLVWSQYLRYAGLTDIDCVLNGSPALIDIKTGSVPAWVDLQLAAYDNALFETDGTLRRLFSLNLRADGTYRLRQYHRTRFQVFSDALITWRQANARDNDGPCAGSAVAANPKPDRSGGGCEASPPVGGRNWPLLT